MSKFGNTFVSQSPIRLIFNLGIKFSIFSISNPVMWICALILGKIFASQNNLHHIQNKAVISEVVTSIGLMQSINIIGVVFFIAIGAGSNTYIARLFGRFLANKKNLSLQSLAGNSEIKYLFGSTLFCFFALCVLLTPIILLLGPYVAKLQNFYMPTNYLKNIHILLLFYVLSLPFFGFITFNAYHLNSEGNSGWCAIMGILNILFFVGFAFLFHHYQPMGGIYPHITTGSDANQVIVYKIGCAILFTGMSLFLAQIVILYCLYHRRRSIIFSNLASIFWVKSSVLWQIIKISLPIYVRVMVSFLTIITLNIAIEFLRFPDGGKDFVLAPGQDSAGQPPMRQLYATYWQYIIFSINSIFIIIYRIIASFSNTAIRAVVGFYYGQKNYRKIYTSIKASFVYCILIIVAYEIIFTANAGKILSSLFGLRNGHLYEVIYHGVVWKYQARHILDHATMIFRIWNATIFVIAFQYICPGISLTLGKIKITYFMFTVDKIIFSIPLMIILLLISTTMKGPHNYVLFFCNSVIADILTLFVAIFVLQKLIKGIKKDEIAFKTQQKLRYKKSQRICSINGREIRKYDNS